MGVERERTTEEMTVSRPRIFSLLSSLPCVNSGKHTYTSDRYVETSLSLSLVSVVF